MSRRFFFLMCIAMSSFSIVLGQDPVSWQYSVQKKAGRTYEVHFKATILQPWHIYSQVQPEDAIPTPTEIKFVKNPMLTITGKPKELGIKEVHKDAILGSTDYRYSGSLDFVQTIIVKGTTKTNVSGTITYQLCTEEQCLPVKTVSFNLSLK